MKSREELICFYSMVTCFEDGKCDSVNQILVGPFAVRRKCVPLALKYPYSQLKR